MDIKIFPPEEMIECSVALPLSKSMSARALIINALSPAPLASLTLSDCDDTAALRQALEAMAAGQADINVGPAGTAMRFLTAYAAAVDGACITLDGDNRMRQRPIGALVDALRSLGADIEYAGKEGFPPLRIRGKSLTGGSISIDASVSSQFVSAIAMVAPTFEQPLALSLLGEPASLPYLKLTVAMMRACGIDAELAGSDLTVQPGAYDPQGLAIEPDWSAAAFWYELAAVSAGWVTLPGLDTASAQGDSELASIYERLGVITRKADPEEDGCEGICLDPSPEVFSRLDLDLSGHPDLAPALAVTCCLLSVPFRFDGLASLRVKECDRLDALRYELAKLSFALEIERDSLIWQMGRIPVESVVPISTYDDHRMAMAFAPAAIFAPGITLRHAECVSKSYPQYWDHLRSAGFTIQEI